MRPLQFLQTLPKPDCQRELLTRSAALLLLAAVCQAPELMAQDNAVSATHNLSAAAYYSRGDYGYESDGKSALTRIHYLPLSYELSLQRWRFKATVPHINISGYRNVLVNIGGIGRDRGSLDTGERVSASGLGDIVLSASYELDPLFDGAPFIDITAELKLPTADETRGLGTGEKDYSAQLDLFQIYAETTWFATLGYRRRGRSELFEGLTDSWFASLGLMRPWSAGWLQQLSPGQWSYGLIYDYRQAATHFSAETHELVPYLSWNPLENWTLMSYLVKGFTRDSADIAVGAQLSYRW